MPGCGAAVLCASGCCWSYEACCGEYCCSQSEKCCGETCCPAGSFCCGGTCCSDGSFCCGDDLCCEEQDSCGLWMSVANAMRSTCTSTASQYANTTIIMNQQVAATTTLAENTTISTPNSATNIQTIPASASSTETASSATAEADIAHARLSPGTIAGVVIAVVAVLCILGGVLFWRKRQRREKIGNGPYKPTGGRYELGTDKADASEHWLEAEGLGVQEMEVPPVEAGEGGVHELSAESRPVEIGNTGTA